MNVFYYNGIKKIYFNKILFEIIKMGSLKNKKKILDFGCGSKQLEKLLKKKIINYDKNKKFTEVSSYKKVKFDIAIINHVLMYMSKNEIKHLFRYLKKNNKNSKFIIGISKISIINKIAAFISFSFKAHSNIKSNVDEQKEIIFDFFKVISKKNIFFMTDIYYLKFK